jgi:hypothetical protein
MNLTVFSQKTELIDGDTVICFTIPQSKFLLKQVYLVTEKDTLCKILTNELFICKQQNEKYKENINLYEQISVKEIQTTNNNSAILSQKSVEIELLKTQLKFQKIKTIFASATGFVTTIFFSYLWIIK